MQLQKLCCAVCGWAAGTVRHAPMPGCGICLQVYIVSAALEDDDPLFVNNSIDRAFVICSPAHMF